MSPAPKPCMRERCDYPKMKGRNLCYWHTLEKLPIERQSIIARGRLSAVTVPHRPRVPSDQWPAGHRWCAGCQTMVPTWYASGSRCRACESTAKHASYLARTYTVQDPATGLLRPMTGPDYEALWVAQGGRCALCRRKEGAEGGRRFAVDHDHATGIVRGLLCSDEDWGCNRKVLSRFDADPNPVLMAHTLVDYLTGPSWMTRVLDGQRLALRPLKAAGPESDEPPPF